MKKSHSETAIIRIHCPDQKGLVARITDFIHRNNGNIVALDQHTDRDEGRFFMRVEWELHDFEIKREDIAPAFQFAIATPCNMEWKLHFSDYTPRMGLFVSKLSHCLYDILSRYQSGEMKVAIPVVISNHKDLEEVVNKFGIKFVHIPITPETKAEQEKKELEILEEHKVDFLVLARYMQVLSQDFADRYPERIINIHHSFLPAFIGAKPYHAAHARGVKIIGATAHYVTSELDAGPIIEQDVVRITHHDSVERIIQKGRDLEKIVLSRAIMAHLNRKTLVYKNKTVLFE